MEVTTTAPRDAWGRRALFTFPGTAATPLLAVEIIQRRLRSGWLQCAGLLRLPAQTRARRSGLGLLWIVPLTVAWLCVSGAASAAKFDMSPYFGSATVGDFRLYELSTGGTRLEEITGVYRWKKGLRITSLSTQTDLEPAEVEAFAIPGKKTFLGDSFSAGLFVDLKKPKTMYKMRVKPGKTNRVRANGRAFFEGSFIGKAKYKAEWIFSGLEPLDTPAASYPDTARVNLVLALIIKDRVFGDVVEAVTERAMWAARGLGEVARLYRTTTWVNGAMVDDTGWIDAWLVDARIGGQSHP